MLVPHAQRFHMNTKYGHNSPQRVVWPFSKTDLRSSSQAASGDIHLVMDGHTDQKKHNVEPVLYMVEWFMCIFCRTLPWPTVLRVWDMFFCEGAKVLFKVALVLFKYGLGTKEQCKQYPDLHSIVTRLRNLPPQITTEEFLVEKVCDLNLNDADLEKIHFRALKLRQIKIAQR
ncbi:hypothetical protein Y032_0100g3226 [Ancylostoma ceylanicum]|uniref:Rab-GAP TBC domain-containing protein n=1 Tax=Ancylostoma ceylanicum TaxID=53326 RepID=A0A016TH56_9BILA|nr:hypothetical protein Y032_0100g3226 [Ancylostoma ceylanicum]